MAAALSALRMKTELPLPSPFSFDPHRLESFPFQPEEPKQNDAAPQPSTSKETVFLGLDLSTQALKASFTDQHLKGVGEWKVEFDKDLPHFGTTSGVHMRDGGVVTSPVAMWLEALDLLFTQIHSSPHGKLLLSRVVAISGAAQQHASVYWSASSTSLLKNLESSSQLSKQLDGAFSIATSPNWQDSSTTKECKDMEDSVGGAEEMAKRTGSKAHERFTGPQILKLRRNHPELYEATARISLASSFLTTILCADGEIKSMEESDACGMNLWNLEKGNQWDRDLLAVVSGDTGNGVASASLSQKLGSVEQDGSASAGNLGSWWCSRFNMNPECLVSHFTGDNPATLLSFSLLSGDVIVSLGTSDTILLSTTTYAPRPETHVFAYPANYPNAEGKRSYMAMLCYKNGSLPREAVRDQFAGGSWEAFNQMVDEVPTPKTVEETRDRELGFWFLKPEIIPHNGRGTHRFTSSGEAVSQFKNPRFNPRAILESQFLSFRSRSSKMLSSTTGVPHCIYAVGGASANATILGALSSVMGAPVQRPASSSTSCSIGGAMKAFWCWKRANGAGDVCFEDIVHEAQSASAVVGEGKDAVCAPEEGAFEAYGGMLERFSDCEKRACLS